MEKNKKSSSCNSHILGPDLPDVWTPRHANSSLPPLSFSQNQIQDNEELIPKIIDGKSIAEEIRSVIAEEVRQMNNAIRKVPGLAVVLVGQRRDSQSYVRSKRKACEEVGIKSLLAELPDDCADDDVVNVVLGFNEDPSIHGILVQLPLPQHMDEEKILSAISLEKDVDGFHPLNVGNLAMSGGEPFFIPCAAKACIELLLRSGVELMTKNVAVIGRSKVVGLPTSLLLQIFRSQDYSAIIYCLKQLFEKVEVYKPLASRNTSAEIYAIGMKYKAPAKIDPRLLDIKHLFQGAIEPPKVMDVLKGTKQKRNRGGYEDGVTTLWKVALVSDFIWSEAPLEFLGTVGQLSFEDPACLSVKNHELTTEEIRSMCEDLYVLDKHSFKHLLKWRMRIRKELSSTNKVTPKATPAKDANVDEDDNLLNEMEELTSTLERKKKREKKLLAKRRAKDKVRKATGMQIDATQDSYYDSELFSLAAIKGKKELQAVDSTQLDEENVDVTVSDCEDETCGAAADHDSPSEKDSDEEQKRYDEQLEEMLDQAYERYIAKKGGSAQQRKRVKLARSNGQAELFEGDDGEDLVPDHDCDQDQNNEETNPLIVPLHEEEQPTQEQIMEQWFSQDIFAEAADEGVFEKSDSEDEKEEEEVAKVPKKSKPIDSVPSKIQLDEQESFEIVPSEPLKVNDDSSSSSSDEDSDEEDEDTKAEKLAYAKKMLRKRKREEILDDGYNKYMFDDEGLPKWFVEEEKKHCQPMKPITREEVAAMKAQFREIDARPAKKVAQAKARKKRVTMKRLEKVKQKSNIISDQTDISERSKRKMIEQLYKKAAPKKPQREYVVAKKGVQVRPGKGKKLVDPRMKKDSRSRGMGRSGKKGGGRKGKVGKGGPKGKGQKAGGGKGRRKGGKTSMHD